MKPIRRDGHFAPFSHEAGICFPLSGTSCFVQIFPCQLKVFTWKEGVPSCLSACLFALEGPLTEFTVQSNLEQDRGILVWGHSRKGFIRYRIAVKNGRMELHFEKMPAGGIQASLRDAVVLLQEGVVLDLGACQTAPFPAVVESLSFGSHKQQEWALVRRRLDMTEIWPIWFMLAQQVPGSHEVPPVSNGGMAALLHACKSALEGGHPEHVFPAWKRLFLAGFHGMLVPRLFDDEHQGIIPNDTAASSGFSPLVLLKAGGHLMREHFLQEQGDRLLLLPTLPPELHCGRMHAVAIQGGRCDLEWTKKTIRRVVLTMEEERELELVLVKCKGFRIRHSPQEKGKLLSSPFPRIFLKKGSCTLLDNFST